MLVYESLSSVLKYYNWTVFTEVLLFGVTIKEYFIYFRQWMISWNVIKDAY
jgi:hypothetical protein